ncbi:MAG: hypothetical protein LBN38_05910 [Verrucomicrobiota bacterium]|jgi:hypothetical protein|nr:hypothetical protein [Verrucomicrobiota bacterium]
MNAISPPAPFSDRHSLLQGFFFLVLFAVVAVLVFHALWPSGAILLTTDDNVGSLASYKWMMESSVVHPWMGDTLWGMPQVSSVRPDLLLLHLMSAKAFANLFHGFCLTWAAWLLALYLRGKGLRPAACVFGALVAFWVGTNLTLTYAGHIGKYGILVFCSLAIWALGRWGRTSRSAWAMVAGASVGAMFLEQGDVALFCALLLLPLGIYETAQAAGGWNPAGLFKRAWPGALVAALVASGAVLATLKSGVADATEIQHPEERWDFITQWSQPPEESLDFIAPGWTGWRTGEESGPYWGRLGRSAGWEQTRRGFMNFKLENVYVGAIPLLFAALGWVQALHRRREDAASTWLLLWGGLCLLALLLSFGKYTPLYRPFSWLPGIGSIRNPNKFIHFFQMAWGVLAAYGLNSACRMEKAGLRRWAACAWIAAGVCFLSWLALWSGSTTAAQQLAQMGWGPSGQVIQSTKVFALFWAGLSFFIGGGVLWSFACAAPPVSGAARPPARGRLSAMGWKTAAWLPAVMVVVDACWILAPHYIHAMPKGYVAENELVRYLKRDLGFNRSAMAGQDGFYNLWLTYLFPYLGIPSVNVTQLPRPPADYSAFWQAVRDPVRQWRLSAVSHVLAKGSVAGQMLANPVWAEHMDVAWAYQPEDDGMGGVATRSLPLASAVRSLESTPEVVLKMREVPPRVAAVSDWLTVEDAEALSLLARPDFIPFSTVLLAPENDVPPPAGGAPATAQVRITRLLSGRYEFTVETTGPVVVRVAEKFDASWTAAVNGRRVPVQRVDYMFQGVYLPEAGTFDVLLRYAPSSFPVYLQLVGLVAGLGAAGWLLVAFLFRRKGWK